MAGLNTRERTRIGTDRLRWRCDEKALGFTDTSELEPSSAIVGQDAAIEALTFGIECLAPGQNVYVRGISGTGRRSMIHEVLDRLNNAPAERYDRCYVHNFSRPDRPRLITLAAGQGRRFRQGVEELAGYVASGLAEAMDGEHLAARRSSVQTGAQEEIAGITAPLEAELKRAGMALATVQAGNVPQTVIFPLVDGKPVPPEQFYKLAAQDKIPEERKKQFDEHYPRFLKALQDIGRQVNAVYRQAAEQINEINEAAARELLEAYARPIQERHDTQAVATFLGEVIEDVVDKRLRPGAAAPDPAVLYGVNVVVEQSADGIRPVVEELSPSLINLLGTVEPEWDARGNPQTDYRGIRAGALLRADQGYLVLDTKDLLAEPGAWRALTRTLRNRRLEIVPAEWGFMRPVMLLKPEPIDLDVRVILIGDAMTYYQLDALDPDFGDLFKVLADVDNEIERSETGINYYAKVMAQISREEGLLPFTSTAIAALTEHGARIVSRAGKLTARFGRIADIAREASYLAARAGGSRVTDEQVRMAVQRTKERASLPSKKFQDIVHSGTIRVETRGAVTGQVNGLAVIRSGPLTYGFPARITATIGPGRAGLINIEGRASMSGAIHTKGFHILGGLLRSLLATDHPLAFSASLAFEQSYGGIDGDSASCAEICCLLSALTGIPIRQSMAITGAIDQHGNVQAIGGIDEKIEGFFDTCSYFGLTGEQGVIIPDANVPELMLREDVVAACERGEFHVHGVSTVHDALELLTGMPAGTPIDGVYPEGSLLGIAVEQAGRFWRRTLAGPDKLTSVEVADTGEGGDAGAT